MDKHVHHFIYKVTRDDGYFYIGRHSTDKIDDGYLGSGLRISRSIAKYGKDKHRREILEFLPSYDQLKLGEAQIVTEELLCDPLCLNLAVGGHGGFLKGRVPVSLQDGSSSSVTKDEFYTNNHLYKASNIGKCAAKNMKTGESVLIDVSSLDNENFIHHCAEKVFAQTETGNRFVSCEEFLIKGYHGINYGKVGGHKNPRAKHIKIFDGQGKQRFDCHGDFMKTCRENSLPFVALRKSYAFGGTPIYQDKRSVSFATKFGFGDFIGWCAIEVPNAES